MDSFILEGKIYNDNNNNDNNFSLIIYIFIKEEDKSFFSKNDQYDSKVYCSFMYIKFISNFN